MKNMLGVAAVLLCVPSAQAFQYWNDIRHSALLPDSSIVVRTENPNGTGDENTILYLNNTVESRAMVPVLDGPATIEAAVPGPLNEPVDFGFRLIRDAELELMPVRIAEDVDPAPEQLTQLTPDVSGDELFGYDHLDLVDCRLGFSETELHVALQNVGGGFPVVQGLTFFGYLLGIADPAAADPDTVWALMYTFEQAGIISPGVYKITGTGLGDLEKLGDVEIQEFPATNQLRLSCQFSDLLSDPDFASWYDPGDPTLSVAAFTQRITLFEGVEEADRTPGGRCYRRTLTVEPVDNALPTLAGAAFLGEGMQATAQIGFADPNGHCPVLAEIVFDGTDAFPLYPLSLDYDALVLYSSEAGIEPLANGTWEEARFRFSDNLADVVEMVITSTGVPEGYTSDPRRPLIGTVYPIPFRPAATIELCLSRKQQARVSIFDASGALVKRLVRPPATPGIVRLRWDGRGDDGRAAGSGVYFLEVVSGEQNDVRRLLLVR